MLLDTGLHISEALGIERRRIDLDQMVLTVMGKGSKERLVPFSPVLRKALLRRQRLHQRRLLFATRTGVPISYRNAARDLQRLCGRAGVKRKAPYESDAFQSRLSSRGQHGSNSRQKR